jgi:hypothetical protein
MITVLTNIVYFRVCPFCCYKNRCDVRFTFRYMKLKENENLNPSTPVE